MLNQVHAMLKAQFFFMYIALPYNPSNDEKLA